LQAYLAEQGMSSFKVLTPQRTYTVRKSRYGAKRMVNQTSIPNRPRVDGGIYAINADEGLLARLQAATGEARRCLEEHTEQSAALDERHEQAQQVKQQRLDEMRAFMRGFEDIANLEKRLPAIRQRLTEAKRVEAEFDIGVQREALRKKLVAAARVEAKCVAKFVSLQQTVTRCNTEAYGAKLAWKSAAFMMSQVENESNELGAKVDEVFKEVAHKKEEAKAKFQEAAHKKAQARQAAPQFEKDGRGERKQEAQAAWDAMANDYDELVVEIESLEEAVANADDDDGKTLREYEARCKEIEKTKEKVGDTEGEVEEKRERLQSVTSEWKPNLQKMVAEVDANFSAYFARFNCVGNVELADGRKANPHTGALEGPDDYAAYKVHIKVQWRESESLHVLGEGGRDSGGERSVATMIYLISLQTVNPAPFRVVDEINQAMDSHNERHVFECITHACRSGGKQYFLLTPKLLPDLDYGEETALQLVLNGPFALPKASFSLAAYV